jgi:hypothetical protein
MLGKGIPYSFEKPDYAPYSAKLNRKTLVAG